MADRYGTNGDDNLVGTSSGDNFFGLAGNDTFAGGPGNDWVWGGAGVDIVKFEPDKGWVKFFDFQDGVDKIDAQGLAFNRLGVTYDPVWKYTWITDPNGVRTLGLKNLTPDKLTAADFINLGSGTTVSSGSPPGSSGSTGGTPSPAPAPAPSVPAGGDNSISARNGMLKIWQDDWAGKLARGDLDTNRFFDPVPGNNNWDSRNSGEPAATAKSLVWTSDAADRPGIGKHAAMALTTFRGVEGGYNAFSNASSYFDAGYDKMSVAADFYFPTSYAAASLTQPGAPINVKNMFGLYASAKGVGKPGGTLLQPSNGNQNATWVDFYFKQNAVFGQDGYGHNNIRFGIGTTDFNRTAVGLEGKADAGIAIPKGKWVRLEGYVQMDTNGHNGIARLYQDGQLISEVTNLDLGGARYGWKLHGFMGTWMWGGAGDKYVSAQTETFYIKNMRIYDDPPTGDGAVADADDAMDADGASAAFATAAMEDHFDPAATAEAPVIVTAEAGGEPDYLTATAVTEAAAATAAPETEEAPAPQSEEVAAAAEAPAEGQPEAAADTEAAMNAALAEAALVAANDAANPPPPAADANTDGAAAETATETTEDALAQVLVPAHDPAAFLHIA
jgi:hypothetical protein